jgi:hypothetical protein
MKKSDSREATPLEYALMAYERMRNYEPADLSSNERAILALGAEVKHLQAALRRCEISLRHLSQQAKP